MQLRRGPTPAFFGIRDFKRLLLFLIGFLLAV